MGIEVQFASPERVLLSATLAPNVNHQGTAFGGSIGSLAMLAGWSWMWVIMRERKSMPKLVISNCRIDFIAPVEGAFTAELRPPCDSDVVNFVKSFDLRGSARMDLTVEILCKGHIVAKFKGGYVAIQS